MYDFKIQNFRRLENSIKTSLIHLRERKLLARRLMMVRRRVTKGRKMKMMKKVMIFPMAKTKQLMMSWTRMKIMMLKKKG
jgi:hypothetical protein